MPAKAREAAVVADPEGVDRVWLPFRTYRKRPLPVIAASPGLPPVVAAIPPPTTVRLPSCPIS